MGLAVAALARLARGAPCRTASDRARLASPRLSPVLDMEEPTSHRAPGVPADVRASILREMSTMNPLWGAPRIHGELMKLGIKISEASVAKYMVRNPKPPSQTWRTFLGNHVSQLASVDFFTGHTVWFEILFVFIVLTHDRRRIVHFNVTAHPTAEWTALQIREAFPFDTAPRYLLRDRDRIYGQEFASKWKS